MTGRDLLRAGVSDIGLALAAAGFAALWDGRAATPDELLPRHGGLAEEAALELAGRGRAELDDDGRLVGVHGLTLRPTRHRFVAGGRVHHTWCAFDSIGIPAALGLSAQASTTCPTCERPVEVALRAGTPDPGPQVVWLPAAGGDHLMATFCASADAYCSLEHLGQRIDRSAAAGEVVDLAGAASAGRETWADVAALDHTWDPT